MTKHILTYDEPLGFYEGDVLTGVLELESDGALWWTSCIDAKSVCLLPGRPESGAVPKVNLLLRLRQWVIRTKSK